MPVQFSIVIPTLNECENINPLLIRLFAQNLNPDDFEIIFVDDGSIDGTADKIKAWARDSNVRLVERKQKPDLTASILAGVAAAKSDLIVVMDADLSHPPERISALVTPILEGHYDVVVGSRYVQGGGTENWPFYRQLLSRVGGGLAQPICDVNDATSGLFAFRRELAATISNNAKGYKILLELLMANYGKLRIKEIPINFHDRTHGKSKLSFSHQLAYLERLIALAGGTATLNTAGRFAAVGLFGVFIDAAVFQWMISLGVGLAAAHFLSFFAAVSVNYALNSKWAFREYHRGNFYWQQFGRFLTVAVLALLLRGGVLAFLVYVFHMSPQLAIFPAIVATAAINYLGSAFYVFPNKENPSLQEIRWRTATIGIVIFILLLRLIYFGLAQLIPDEAYYWQYAQHMDLSFYDHPPMVAWLIWLGTEILGHNEFGVRIGALLCGLVTMGYLYALALNLYNKSVAMCTLLLLAVLPIGFVSGLLMTPDAPLMAAWAATLYYMERALLNEQHSAWLGVGIALGLGLLSKYSVGLVGIAALVFVIIDPMARRWLIRPHPYLAVMIAALFFSPVILWNYEHDWASFAFQSNRLLPEHQFSMHYLILHMVILLTPIGFWAAIIAFFPIEKQGNNYSIEHRKRRFVQIFTGVPLVVCLILSIFGDLKFHWTAPIWLALLPTIAAMIAQAEQLGNLARRFQAAWHVTIIGCVLAYSFVLHYVVLGIPGIPYAWFTEHYFWREAASEIAEIVEEVKYQTDKEPIVVGMSKWSVASALQFYSPDKSMDIHSRNMFGDSGAMYEFWSPTQTRIDRPVIQVGMKPLHIERTESGLNIKSMLDQPGAIECRTIERYGVPVRQVCYRIASGFLGYKITESNQQAVEKVTALPPIMLEQTSNVH